MTDFLADTSALVRLLRRGEPARQWRSQVGAGMIGICATVELELLWTTRSASDRQAMLLELREAFPWVVTPDAVFERASEVQDLLTRRGAHRSAGVVDLLVAATAELGGLTLLHYDRDFEQVAVVTGQRVRWLARPGSID